MMMEDLITIEEILVYFNDELKQQPISGYTPEIDSMSGSLGWSKGGDGPIIWATPNWDRRYITPFDIQYPDSGDYESYCEVDFSDRSHDEQYKIYFTILVLAIEYLENKNKVTVEPTLEVAYLNIEQLESISEYLENKDNISVEPTLRIV